VIQTTATLHPGDKCIDYAGWRDYDAMKRLGVKCAGRYIATTSSFSGPIYSWKSLTPAEVSALHARGIGVIAFWEASAGDPLQGELKGVAHGVQAVKSLQALGYPAGLPCIAAVDFDATPANLNACAAYIKGFRAGLGGRWATGVYGDVDIIKRCAADGTASIFHYAGASSWSHGTFTDLIHLRQRISGSTPNYDDNAVLRDTPMWLPHEVPDIPPDVIPEPPPAPLRPPQEEDDDMKVIIQIEGYANAWADNLHLTPELVAELQAQGYKIVTSKVHPQHLRSLLFLSGLHESDLVHL